ncbi:MAG: beta-phosphoglucomutase family hydrolase [Thermoleophilaceae bacterium]|nr:beta-phosphoglucomutase family hydrolase [Thermoleophilaceae bacterium]
MKPPDPKRIGLPAGVTTLLFDLDGVITRTAVVHAAAWKEMFDSFLALQPDQPPFDPRADYDKYVDGKPRYDGVRSFLASRGIQLPDGEPSDTPDERTVCGLGNRKNDLVTALIERDGVEAYPGTLKYLAAAKAAGMRLAVVSSSANCRAILESCSLINDFEEIMDGVVAAERGIRGKPAPDTFIAAAEALGASVEESVVFEDAIAGVEAGRAGGFGHVVGVNRVGQAEALKTHGADTVVDDLEELIP